MTLSNYLTEPKRSKLANKLRGRKVIEVAENPMQELKKLVRMHKRWIQTAVSWEQSVSDRTMHETGEVIECTLPQTFRDDIKNQAQLLRKEAERLERSMRVQLQTIPIYKHFLSKIFGVGDVLAAYLVTMIDIRRCVKPSQLIRYCGNANSKETGRLERRSAAPRYDPKGEYDPSRGGTYNQELRNRLFLFFRFARMNQRHGTSKYLERWTEAKEAALKVPGTKPGFADSKGRRKATDLFLEDLYIVWRSLEGLTVFPDWYSVKRGVGHQGRIIVPEGKVLSLEEALEFVGIQS